MEQHMRPPVLDADANMLTLPSELGTGGIFPMLHSKKSRASLTQTSLIY